MKKMGKYEEIHVHKTGNETIVNRRRRDGGKKKRRGGLHIVKGRKKKWSLSPRR